MGTRVIHVMTHDSIAWAKTADPPAVEHLAALRPSEPAGVPPADAVETAECWKAALMEKTAPSLMALSRQKTAAVRTTGGDLSLKGATNWRRRGRPGPGDHLRLGDRGRHRHAARALLKVEGIPARVVSTPCWELFERQDETYRAAVIGTAPIRIAVEAAVRMGWERFIGEDGLFVGMTASAPRAVRAAVPRVRHHGRGGAAAVKSKLSG